MHPVSWIFQFCGDISSTEWTEPQQYGTCMVSCLKSQGLQLTDSWTVSWTGQSNRIHTHASLSDKVFGYTLSCDDHGNSSTTQGQYQCHERRDEPD